jgi:hypothetical protein
MEENKIVKQNLQIAETLEANLNALTIEDQEQLSQTSAVLKEIKARLKAVETERTNITKPMNAALKNVNDLFRAPKEALQRCEKILKGKINEYTKKREEECVKALEGGTKIELAALEKGMSQRELTKFEVTNPDRVPKKYMCVDEKEIRAAIKENPDIKIAGVKIYTDKMLTVRT